MNRITIKMLSLGLLSLGTVLWTGCDSGEQPAQEGPTSERSISGDSVYNVMDYSAAGDCSTDDGPEIQNAIDDAITYGGTVFFPEGCYQIGAGMSGDSLVVDGSTTLWSAGRAELHWGATAQKPIVEVEASDVTIRDLRFTSDEDAMYAANSHGINVADPSGGSLSAITIEGSEFNGFGHNAINMVEVEEFSVVGNHIEHVAHGGVMILSGFNGVVSGNNIADITADGTPGAPNNAYGIAVTRDEAQTEANAPRSRNVTVEGNSVSGVEFHCLDTHGGENITFVGNALFDCYYGVYVTTSELSGSPALAPRNVTVSSNVIDSSKTDGSQYSGVHVVGISGSSPEYAQGVVVSNNTVRNHGGVNSLSGGVFAQVTKGLVVTGNSIVGASPYGVILYIDNDSFSVTGNTIVDPWYPTGAPAGISVHSNDNKGYIGGNHMSLDERPLAMEKALVYGVRLASLATIDVRLGDNPAPDATTSETSLGALTSHSAQLESDDLFISGARIKVGSSAPGPLPGQEGDLYLNTGAGASLHVYDGGGWVAK